MESIIRRCVVKLTGFNIAVIAICIFTACSPNSELDDDHADDHMDDDTSDGRKICSHDETKGEAWIDESTDLTWQTGNSCSPLSHESAVKYCENLEIDGIGDWRLPTISELRTLIRDCHATMTGGDCSISDDCFDWTLCDSESCSGCVSENGDNDGCYSPSEMNCLFPRFVSSTPTSMPASDWWCVMFGTGGIVQCWTGNEEGDGDNVRCVRGS